MPTYTRSQHRPEGCQEGVGIDEGGADDLSGTKQVVMDLGIEMLDVAVEGNFLAADPVRAGHHGNVQLPEQISGQVGTAIGKDRIGHKGLPPYYLIFHIIIHHMRYNVK